jgi:hypothetical protein
MYAYELQGREATTKSSLLANIPEFRVQWGELIINLQLFLTLQSTAATAYTACCNTENYAFCSVYLCFVLLSQQTAIICRTELPGWSL